MTAIIFYARELQDTQAPGLSLRLEAGRASYGSDEFFSLGTEPSACYSTGTLRRISWRRCGG
jgi:hypothetical protein